MNGGRASCSERRVRAGLGCELTGSCKYHSSTAHCREQPRRAVRRGDPRAEPDIGRHCASPREDARYLMTGKHGVSWHCRTSLGLGRSRWVKPRPSRAGEQLRHASRTLLFPGDRWMWGWAAAESTNAGADSALSVYIMVQADDSMHADGILPRWK